MKVIAHVGTDGRIQGLITVPEGLRHLEMVAPPGLQVCELVDHGLDDKANLDALIKLVERYTVTITRAQGKLIRKKSASADGNTQAKRARKRSKAPRR